jgi:hypothetical protein
MAYLAIEEFSGGGRWGIILLPEGREKWGWCGFGKVLRFQLEPYFTVKQLPLAFHGDPCVSKHSRRQLWLLKPHAFLQFLLELLPLVLRRARIQHQ